jgi:hypothetical protein
MGASLRLILSLRNWRIFERLCFEAESAARRRELVIPFPKSRAASDVLPRATPQKVRPSLISIKTSATYIELTD